MTDDRNDPNLSPDYDPRALLRRFAARLADEERRVLARAARPDPGDDATVIPPVADDDADGHDPQPSSPSVRN